MVFAINDAEGHIDSTELFCNEQQLCMNKKNQFYCGEDEF